MDENATPRVDAVRPLEVVTHVMEDLQILSSAYGAMADRHPVERMAEYYNGFVDGITACNRALMLTKLSLEAYDEWLELKLSALNQGAEK